MDLCFSPDGSVLGVASADGYAYLWQVTRVPDAHPLLVLIHRWSPHQQISVFSIRFVDDVILTGSKRNAELEAVAPRSPFAPRGTGIR